MRRGVNLTGLARLLFVYHLRSPCASARARKWGPMPKWRPLFAARGQNDDRWSPAEAKMASAGRREGQNGLRWSPKCPKMADFGRFHAKTAFAGRPAGPKWRRLVAEAAEKAIWRPLGAIWDAGSIHAGRQAPDALHGAPERAGDGLLPRDAASIGRLERIAYVRSPQKSHRQFGAPMHNRGSLSRPRSGRLLCERSGKVVHWSQVAVIACEKYLCEDKM